LKLCVTDTLFARNRDPNTFNTQVKPKRFKD
jgi:hypothetical protein